MRSARTATILIAGLALALQGCGGSADSADSQDGPIQVGAFAPLSGPSASIGTVGKAGFDLAIKHLNEAGGVLGRELDPIMIDTAGDPVQALSSVQRLVEREKVDVVVNAGSTAEALGVADYMASQKVINLIAVPSGDGLADAEKYPYAYQFGVTSTGLAVGNAQIAIDQGFERVAVAKDSLDVCKGAAAAEVDTLTEAGVEPVADIDFATDTNDKSAVANAIKDADADALIICTLPATYAKVFEAMARADIDIPVIGYVTVTVPQMAELGGDYLPANFASAVMNKPFWREDLPQAQQFLKEYTAMYDKAPLNTADVAVYDAVLIWAAAAEEAGTTDPTAVKKAMDSGKEFSETGSKPFSFSEDDHEGWDDSEVAPVYLVKSPEGAGAFGGWSWLDAEGLEQAGLSVPAAFATQ